MAIFCSSCGKQIKEGGSFCTACGKIVAQAQPAVTAVKKKSKTPFIIGGAAVLVVALIVAGVFTEEFGLFGKPEETKGNVASNTASPTPASTASAKPTPESTVSAKPTATASPTPETPKPDINWPDNEFTRQLPKPDFTAAVAEETDDHYYAIYFNIDLDQYKAYLEQLKAAGFTEGARERIGRETDPKTGDNANGPISAFDYRAKNADGYEVRFEFKGGTMGQSMVTLDITKK